MLLMLFRPQAAQAGIAWTEEGDGAALGAALLATAAASWTEEGDGAALGVSLLATAAASWTEEGDGAALGAALLAAVAAAWTEQDDGAALGADLLAAATVAWTEQDDAMDLRVHKFISALSNPARVFTGTERAGDDGTVPERRSHVGAGRVATRGASKRLRVFAGTSRNRGNT